MAQSVEKKEKKKLVWKDYLLSYIGRHFLRERRLLVLLAIPIGAVAGLGAVCAKLLIGGIQKRAHSWGWGVEHIYSSSSYDYLGYLLPFVGLVITSLLANKVFRIRFGHAITQVLFIISRRSGIVKQVHMYANFLASSVTVGLGGSLGLEAPMVMTGSAVGSNFARWFQIGKRYRTLLLGCGAAAAISGIFNSPIAGVVFVLEVLLTNVTVFHFVPILIASVVSSVLVKSMLGKELLFSVTVEGGFDHTHILYYALLGLVCGYMSLYFVRTVYFVEDKIGQFKSLRKRILAGGVLLSLLIFLLPPLYGEGYHTITAILRGEAQHLLPDYLNPNDFPYAKTTYTLIIAAFLMLSALCKPVASALTLGAGGSGGIFAPSLMTGAITGYVFALLLNLLPFASLSNTHFLLVGMCGLMSGTQYAPLTAIFLIAEITGGYTLFVPLMLVSAISYATARHFEKYSFYTKSLVHGQNIIPYDRDQQALVDMDIQGIVETDLLTIRPQATISELVKLVSISKRNLFPVLKDDKTLQGIITLDDIRSLMFDNKKCKKLRVQDLMVPPLGWVDKRATMPEIMHTFEKTEAWNLPVLDEGKYVGIISKSSVFNAYRAQLIENLGD